METKIRAKFKVDSLSTAGNHKHVTLSAVIGDSEENKAFWDATPAGNIQLTITNPEAKFEPGEYFVDFTKVEEEEKS